ncbi:hypothetical protein QL093DRAFT_2358916 [Fusarium oxysporum]|nr:hypothetical protein QL093DRAFT_2358916 [Fusarium oxysporum]
MTCHHMVGTKDCVAQRCLRSFLRISAACIRRTLKVEARGSGEDVLDMYINWENSV